MNARATERVRAVVNPENRLDVLHVDAVRGVERSHPVEHELGPCPVIAAEAPLGDHVYARSEHDLLQRAPVRPGHERVARVRVEQVEGVEALRRQRRERRMERSRGLRAQRLDDEQAPRLSRWVLRDAGAIRHADEQAARVQSEPRAARRLVARCEEGLGLPYVHRGRRPVVPLVTVGPDDERKTREVIERGDERAHGRRYSLSMSRRRSRSSGSE